MTSTEEVKIAPLPKVPTSAWRWPPSWPFPDDFFVPVEVIEESSIGGGFSNAGRSKVQEHLSYYLTTGSDILEIGSDKLSSLPSSIRFNSISSIALVESALTDSPSKKVANLNVSNILDFPSNNFDFVRTSL